LPLLPGSLILAYPVFTKDEPSISFDCAIERAQGMPALLAVFIKLKHAGEYAFPMLYTAANIFLEEMDSPCISPPVME
jgi:hypothetical protein